MSLLKKIHPEQSLKELRWFDIAIVTLFDTNVFGEFDSKPFHGSQ